MSAHESAERAGRPGSALAAQDAGGGGEAAGETLGGPGAPQERRGLEEWLSARWEAGAFGLIAVVALAMRLWDLGSRAMHHDESMHAVFSLYLFQGRGYEHNPLLHGPFQFHANAMSFFLLGDSDVTARLVYVLFGTALVALPWFLRGRLGRTGALTVALLLAFSPTMLYFSRFARNDILMAVWVLGMVVAMWRYLDGGRPRDLYLLSALLALAFTTKETIFITLAIFGVFLLLVARPWRLRRWPGAALDRPGSLFLVLFTLSLPFGSALAGVAQGLVGLELVNAEPSAGRVGLPLAGAATAVAAGITALVFLGAAALGLAWDWRRWLVCAGIFYGTWIFLYTSVFTNAFGVWTGVWQGLGYWMAQQDVARGGQPWFYYILTGWTYEFLPLLAGLAGMVWFYRREDLFTRFLIFWALGSFFLFTLAGEKMPWLLVHLSLPMILLAGRTLGGLVDWMPWRRIAGSGALLGVAFIPLFLLLAYRLAFYDPVMDGFLAFLRLWGWLLLVSGVLLLVLYFATRAGWREGLALVALGVAGVLFLFTVRAGVIAAYQNGDTPREMLVYTQTSPEVPLISREVGRISVSTGRNQEIPIGVDGSSGFGWPWYWYLRDYTSVSYGSYGSSAPPEASDRSVLLVHADNDDRVRGELGDGYVRIKRYPHRWWFPETYKQFTLWTAPGSVFNREAWRKVADYWLFRKFEAPLGSTDAYLYYSTDLVARAPRP